MQISLYFRNCLYTAATLILITLVDNEHGAWSHVLKTDRKRPSRVCPIVLPQRLVTSEDGVVGKWLVFSVVQMFTH